MDARVAVHVRVRVCFGECARACMNERESRCVLPPFTSPCCVLKTCASVHHNQPSLITPTGFGASPRGQYQLREELVEFQSHFFLQTFRVSRIYRPSESQTDKPEHLFVHRIFLKKKNPEISTGIFFLASVCLCLFVLFLFFWMSRADRKRRTTGMKMFIFLTTLFSHKPAFAF